MRSKQVNLLDKWIVLDTGTTKNNEGRRVRMTDETYRLLAECVRRKQPNDFVCMHEDGRHVRDPRKAWYDLTLKCGLGTLTPAKGKYSWMRYSGLNLHDFRRSAVRSLVRSG